MTPKASFRAESSTTGTLLQMGSQPKSSGEVLYFEAKVLADNPLSGSKPLAAVIRKLQAKPGMTVRFEKARRTFGEMLEPGSNSLRALRLAAGLSQVKLAERAGTTQSYIARIESGRLDPGTDMLERLANAVGMPAVKIFEAVRAQREGTHV